MAIQTGIVSATDQQAITSNEIETIKTALELENVDNTSDQDKPISPAQQNALDDKVDKEVGKGLSDENYTLAEKQNLANQSGVNTGDQDISGIGVNASAINDIEQEQIAQNDAINLNTAKRSYPIADENKLSTIEENATENQNDAFLLARGNHTGTQSSETITHEATEGDVSGTSTLDPTTPLKYWNLTGNFELTGVGAIPSDENKVVTRVITTGTGVEILAIPAAWNEYGTFDPTKRNLVTILIGNVTSGVEVDIIFNQPN